MRAHSTRSPGGDRPTCAHWVQVQRAGIHALRRALLVLHRLEVHDGHGYDLRAPPPPRACHQASARAQQHARCLQGLRTSSMGSGSRKQPCSRSHPAPSKNMPLTYIPSLGGCVMASSDVPGKTWNSKARLSMGTPLLRAVVCSTAVSSPVGYVNPESQYTCKRAKRNTSA
eukprot:scaffold6918_cov380-Prasinococcus_capsulatus_cf.AAC.8